jgi:hypothetical protein
LSDPTPERLAKMLHVGQQSAFPKLKFLANRIKVERKIEAGRKSTRPGIRRGSIESILSEDDMRSLLQGSEGATDEETDATPTGDEFEEAVMEHEAENETKHIENEKISNTIRQMES